MADGDRLDPEGGKLVAKQDDDHKRFIVRLSEEHAYHVERAAARLGLSVTAFIRMATIKEATAVTGAEA